MGSLSATDKEEIVAELKVVASWLNGVHRNKVLALADRVAGNSQPEVQAEGSGPPPSENQ
jgi:hypothetical protein